MTEENSIPRTTTRSSYERKMLTSLPLNNSSINQNLSTSSSSLSSSQRQPDLDFSLLDYKSVDDFLYYTKSKSDFQDLSKHLAKQLKASRSLLSMSRFLTVGSSPREIINKIVDTAGAIIDAERVVFLELDQESGDLVYQKYLDQMTTTTEANFRLHDGIEYDVVMNSHPMIINDVNGETKCNSPLYSHLRIHPRNMICVPVIFSEKTTGVLLALNKLAPDLFFTQFDVSCLQTIAANLAILMRQASLSLGQIDIRISRSPSSLPTEDDREDREAISLNTASSTKISTVMELSNPDLDNNLNQLLSKLVQEAGRDLHADKMSLFIPKTPSQLKCIVSQDIRGLEIPVNKGIVGDTFTSQRHFKIENAKTDPRHYSEVDTLSNNETNSLMSYPIVINGGEDHAPVAHSRVVGVIQAINKLDGAGFTEEDGKYMTNLCSKVAEVLSQNLTHRGTSALGNSLSQGEIMRSLSEFTSLLNRMEEKNYLKNLLNGLSFYGTAIGDCDEFLAFSITTSSHAENNCLELQPVTLDQPVSSIAKLISSSSTHSSLVLDSLKTKQVQKAKLSLTQVEINEVGCSVLNLLILPVTYNSNPQLSSYLLNRSIDVLIAVKKKENHVGIFTSSQVEGLTALARLLSPSLTLYAQILEEEASVAKLQTNHMIISSTLNRLGVMIFVVSSNGEIVMSTPSWQQFLGIDEQEMKSHSLNDLMSDRSPAFMIDVKECIRSHAPREAKNVRIFSSRYPNGILVNYDIHEYKNKLHPLTGIEINGTHTLFRVIISVLPGGDFSCDETTISSNFMVPQDHNSSELTQTRKNEQQKFTMKSTPDAHTLRSPRQFSPSDAAEVERLFTWEFNVLNIVDAAARRYCIIAVLEKDLNLAMLNISRNQLAAFVAEVEKNYRLNPFHNFFHAVGVTHFISMLMRDTQARIHINNDLMYFSMMSSAVVHDVDHPGNTNLFEINSCSELALLYNDIGVLENHHCATAFRIMRLPGLDIFGQLNFAQKTLARKTIISCIMATDMALHVGLVEQMAARTGQPWLIDTPAEKLFYGKIILHSADLSNPVRPFYLSKEWACRVSEEFNRQGEMEKTRGLPVSTFLLTPDTKTLAKNEIYFSGQVVAPMWRSLASLFPTLQHLAIQIESNVESWKELLASLE